MWILVRIYYYAEQKEALLLNCVRPLLEELQQQGLVDQGYFVRYWYRGPHIRLYLRTTQEHLDALKTAVTAATDDYFSRHPSQRILREEDIRATHERLAEVEKVKGPLFPLQPDNSITFEDPGFDAAIYGGETGLKLANLFYARSTPIVFRLLELVEQDRSVLLPQVFNWMLITVAHLGGGLRMSYISYRSHSEGFLHGFDGKGRIRERFEHLYDHYSTQWHQNVEHYLNPSYIPVHELDGAWNDMLEAYLPYLRHAITEQQLLLEIPNMTSSNVSAFHRETLQLPWISAFVSSHHYTIRRLLLNLLYETMLQVGIRPVEKMFLCYSVARSVEEVTGVSWREFQANNDALKIQFPITWGKSTALQEA
jgi:hypothetical protein